MSQLTSSYSKWDKFDESDEEESTAETTSNKDDQKCTIPANFSSAVNPPISATDTVTKLHQTPKGSEKNRHAFQYEGRTVYEWDQSLDEVNIWIKPPPGVTAALLAIDITHSKVVVGIKGNPPFLTAQTGGHVVIKESFWSLDKDDHEVTINLQKMRKGETWLSAFKGHGELDPLTKEDDKKRLMLERFAEENPGFDFSGAEFNGQVPDARQFMGGVKYF
jgi:hypothetical protein